MKVAANSRRRHLADVREVYFVRSEQSGAIKIGVSNDADRRFAALQSASPDQLTLLGIAVTENAEALEERLHNQLAASRLRGEWYRSTPDVERAIATHAHVPAFARFQHCRNVMLRSGRMTALQVAKSLEAHPDCPTI